jgi:hypothetical protein
MVKYWCFICSVYNRIIYLIFYYNVSLNAKLGVSYNVYDGTETLEASIRSLRSYSSYISVVFQKLSNFDEPVSDFDVSNIERLLKLGLIDEVFMYDPKKYSSDLQGTCNEINKRQIGIDLSSENYCDIHMSIDTDEVYETKKLHYALWRFIRSRCTTSVCNHRQYVHDSTWELSKPEGGFVTLFEKIRKGAYDHKIKLPYPVDPTRVFASKNMSVLRFFRFEIEMHHLTLIRRDIEKKYRNSSALVTESSASEVLKSLHKLENKKLKTMQITWPDGSKRAVCRVVQHRIPYISK